MNNKQIQIITWVIVWALTISLLIMIVALNNTRIDNDLINIEYEHRIETLKKQVNTQSDVEILWSNADYARQEADKILSEIEELKAFIVLAEPKYEKQILITVCNKDQINRMINWLEYNTEYCSEESNLELYRTKK